MLFTLLSTTISARAITAALHTVADIQLHRALTHGAVSRFWPGAGMCLGIEALLATMAAGSGCAVCGVGLEVSEAKPAQILLCQSLRASYSILLFLVGSASPSGSIPIIFFLGLPPVAAIARRVYKRQWSKCARKHLVCPDPLSFSSFALDIAASEVEC